MSEEKNKNRYRKNQIKFYVTDEEKEIIELKKNATGIKTLGTYLRKMALLGECKIYNFSPVYEQLKELNYYVSSISKSVNQIAKRVNSTGELYDDDLKSIRSMIDTIVERQKLFIKACVRKDKKENKD
jgi:uncharacterized protein YoxC